MIIIPGIARSGTSWITKKIHEAGESMWTVEHDKHYEDFLLQSFFIEKEVMWWRNQSPSLSLRGDFCSFIEQYSTGFKNPRLIFFLPDLFRIFPEAKYLFCIRNINDWISSKTPNKKEPNWEYKLRSHYAFCIKEIMEYKEEDNVFAFMYDYGNNFTHQQEINSFLDLELDWSDFKKVTYEKVYT